jgi:phosphoribosylformylglycinamidine cyclo-ligase
MAESYRAAGVDIDAHAAWVSRLRDRVSGLGFAGAYEFAGRRLVAGADGVGSKLLLAIQASRLDGVGIDCVAMNVNDVLTEGARPLFFLDYLAVHRFDATLADRVLAGVAAGCAEAGCVLLGGETAQLPDLYAEGHFDLAGFCVGAVERPPRPETMKPGDGIVGLPSSGIHSNGFALVRRIHARDPYDVAELLKPTRIYVRPVLAALQDGAAVAAMAHITGGGLPGNLVRAFPPGLGARLRAGSWPEPAVFAWLRRHVAEEEMRRVFNLGIGFALVSPEPQALADRLGGFVIGEVVRGEGVQWTA